MPAALLDLHQREIQIPTVMLQWQDRFKADARGCSGVNPGGYLV
jgi:hypothetical protein